MLELAMVCLNMLMLSVALYKVVFLVRFCLSYS